VTEFDETVELIRRCAGERPSIHEPTDPVHRWLHDLLDAYDAKCRELDHLADELGARCTINPRKMAKFVYASPGCTCRAGEPYCDACIKLACRWIRELGLTVGEDPYPHEDI